MNKLSCGIIKDLLPLYYDDVCSEDSRKMVEEHLLTCNSCKIELEMLGDEIQLPEKNEIENRNVIKNLSISWKKLRLKSLLKGGIIGALLIAILICGYLGLFHWEITSVDTDVVEISKVSETEDGKIVYFAEINDGYRVRTLKYDMDDKGNFYITPLRPIIKKEAHPPYTFEKGYDFIDLEEQELVRGKKIKAIYYGTPKDRILIWEQGMEVPKASNEVEEYFGFE